MANQMLDVIRTAAEDDLLTFIRLIAPHRVLGKCHEDLIKWWTRDNALDHQMCLLPRDHQKSTMVAYRVAWEITRNPDVTILYISATSGLAEKQLNIYHLLFRINKRNSGLDNYNKQISACVIFKQ